MESAEARKVFAGAWSGTVFVLTYEAPEDEGDPTITLLSGDIREAVATVRQCTDEGLGEGDPRPLGGPSLAREAT